MNNVDEILDFAIDREQEAVDFYTALAGRDGKGTLLGDGVERLIRVQIVTAIEVHDLLGRHRILS